MPAAVHPIEAESYRRLAERVDLAGFGPLAGAVVARVIHATADVGYAATMVVDETVVAAAIEALRRGAPVVVDVRMVAAALSGVSAVCHLPGPSPRSEARSGRAAGPDEHRPREASPTSGPTRAAAGIRAAAALHPTGAVFVVGCAPTALDEIVDLYESGTLRPALVVGTPVGFVGAAEAKDRVRASGLAAITNVGERGGSAVAAAVVNALARLAAVGAEPGASPDPGACGGDGG